MNGLDKLHELVNGVVGGSVSIPNTRLYYINYRTYTSVRVSGRWSDTQEDTHIGPYPYLLAYYISQKVVTRGSHYNADYHRYTSKATLSLRPRRGSVKGTGPNKEVIEKQILEEITDQLDTYRRVQEWFSLSYIPSQGK